MITSVIRESSVFWVVMPCSLVEAHRHFVGTCCLNFRVEEFVKKAGRQRCNLTYSSFNMHIDKIVREYNEQNSEIHFGQWVYVVYYVDYQVVLT